MLVQGHLHFFIHSAIRDGAVKEDFSCSIARWHISKLSTEPCIGYSSNISDRRRTVSGKLIGHTEVRVEDVAINYHVVHAGEGGARGW